MQSSSIRELNQQREEQLRQWLLSLDMQDFIMSPLPSDASFRRYIRIKTAEGTFMAMDAPPEKEPCGPFVAIANGLNAHGLPVPVVKAAYMEQGFLLLTDFGDHLYLQALNAGTADMLYGQAMRHLLHLQSIKNIPEYDCPHFDHENLMYECQHFLHWYLVRFQQLELTADECDMLEGTFELLVQSALAQPQVFTHRDYHSRNLMVLADGSMGILDFQDAVWGPVTYDLVSMLRDCYIDWPPEVVERWVHQFYERLCERDGWDADWPTFWRWFEWMGAQRHIKAAFIFARKFLRDQDPRYLEDIPRTLHYVKDVAKKYPELKDFYDFLHLRVSTA